MRKLLFLAFFSFFFSCSNLKQTAENNATPSLKLISSIVPFEETFQNTKVGGLSGIDYDAKRFVLPDM
jgi:hypothetical protein